MASEEYSLQLADYLKILKRRRWLIAATLLTVVAATGLVSWRMTPIYEGEARVEVQPVSATSSEAAEILERLVDPGRGLETQVELIKSEAVLEKAAEALGLPTIEELEENLEVELVRNTQIVQIRVRHEVPEEARDWTNAVAQAYIDYRRERAIDQIVLASEELSKRIDEVRAQIAERDRNPDPALKRDRDTLVARLGALEAQRQALPDAEALKRGGGTIIAPADTPEEPARPKMTLNLALAAVIGSMLAIGLAFLAESLDDRFRSPEEVEEGVGSPILGYIPYVKEWSRKELFLATVHEQASGVTEAYRTLRTNLRFLAKERPIQTLLVTSALAEEGKSTTAANLAVVFAQAGMRTVLISADLRRPSAHRFFDLPDTRGLLNALDPDFPLENALQSSGISNLRLLFDGGLPPNPTEILSSARFADLLGMLAEACDLVIVDSPPVLGLADSSVIASRVDGVLVVTDPHLATRRNVSHATDQLRKAGGRILGAVINSVEPEEGYGYYYQYYYSEYIADGRGRERQATQVPPAVSIPIEPGEPVAAEEKH